MKSHSDLIPFLNLPPIKLQELLENVVEGTMTFKAARDVADIYNAKARCLRQLENLFNAKSGQLNKTRAVQKGRWITYTSIVDMLPDIPRHLEVWMAPFSKGRLTPVESRSRSGSTRFGKVIKLLNGDGERPWSKLSPSNLWLGWSRRKVEKKAKRSGRL